MILPLSRDLPLRDVVGSRSRDLDLESRRRRGRRESDRERFVYRRRSSDRERVLDLFDRLSCSRRSSI